VLLFSVTASLVNYTWVLLFSVTKNRNIVCDGCSGIFKRHWFSAHKKRCCQELAFRPKAVMTSVFFSEFQVSDDFKKDILSSFSNDEVGKLCRDNEAIGDDRVEVVPESQSQKGQEGRS